MEVIDDSELWMSDEEEFEDGEPDADPTSFTVKLERSGQTGGNAIIPLLLSQTFSGVLRTVGEIAWRRLANTNDRMT